ncbi:MAG TPA: glycosyltransferase family 2 protein [Flavobacterium sp.]
MPLFSIIIPVYNVEKYLNQCINSILNQDFNFFEIILVNDGSTDSSLQICMNYQNADRRVKVIDKKNGGASSARNEGIKKANGEYIIFVDSDDYIESPNLLSEIKKCIEKSNSDIILYGGKNYNIKTDKTSLSRGNYNLDLIKKFHFINTIEYLIKSSLFPGSAWVFATKAEIINENKLFFKTNIIAEDIDWVTKIFKNSFKIDAVNDVFYVYRKNQSDSVTGNAGVKGVKSILSIIEDWKPRLEEEKSSLNLLLLHNLGYYFFTSLILYSKISKEHKKELNFAMKNNFVITKYVITLKLRIVRLLYKVLGLDFASELLTEIYCFKEKFV